MAKAKGTPRPYQKGKLPKGMKPWKPGQSGNPKGKPRGTRHARTVLMEALGENSEVLLNKLMAVAKKGNVQALRTALSPLLAPAADNVVRYKWGSKLETLEEIVSEGKSILIAVSEGKLTPRECEYLSKALERQRAALESAAAGNRREEFVIDEALLAKIRRNARVTRIAEKLWLWFASHLDEEDLQRHHPVVELPRQIAGEHARKR
jgi:hypothetical protein